MKNDRSVALLKLLINQSEYVSSDRLCKELNISDRTLRDDILKFKSLFAMHGVEIVSKHAIGYQMHIFDEAKYYAYIHQLLKEEANEQRILPVYPEDRINYLIKLFLTSETYVKIENVADEIFVSRSTLTNDLKEVRERLRYFHLEIEAKPGYGSKLVGDEFHRRSCIAQYFYYTDSVDERFMEHARLNEEQAKIRDLLYETLIEKDFRLTDIGFQNLIIHISIALLRLKEHKHEEVDVQAYEDLKEQYEYEIATHLAKQIEEMFQVQLPPLEIYYITIHLMSKKNMQYQENVMITEEIETLLQEIFLRIQESYGIAFANDFELYTVLALHFQPMLNRLQFGLSIQNPLLEQIKKENGAAFEIAVLAAKVIEERYRGSVEESEIGYMALHFALAMERKHQLQPNKRIIIVCASGVGSSQILLYKIKQRFQNYLKEVKVSELYELQNIDQSKYDLILTTIPIPFQTQIPAIQVQYFLDGKDVANVSDALKQGGENLDFVDTYFHEELFFTDITGKTRDEVLHELCKRTRKYKQLPEEFEASIKERESFAVTEFGNAIALPHPMKPMSEETFVSIAILPKAIRWQKQMVRFVFLLCIKKDESDALGLFHESMSSLVLDASALSQLEKMPTIQNLKQLLKRIAKAEKDNDIDVLFG